jgi:hypothetical protein
MQASDQVAFAPVVRHPLGLPAGSVRAVLSLIIAGLFWLLLLLPADKDVQVPLYLYFLLGMVLVFFASHGRSIAPAGAAHRSPLGLPRGSILGIIVLGTVAVVGWKMHTDPELLLSRLTPEPQQLPQWPYLLAALVGGFFLGWLIRLGPWRSLYWFQDLQAWVSLIAMAMLGVEIVVLLFINPHLEEQTPINFPMWEEALTAIVAFYFGVRS